MGSAASANLRAPRRVDHAPSSVLRAKEKGATVLGETLAFVCSDWVCDVSATYRLRSAAAWTAEMEFILPRQGEVRVRRAGETKKIVAGPAEPLSPQEKEQLEGGFRMAPLYRARFTVDLPAGDADLTVEYLQPLGAEEMGHGYFSEGVMVKAWTYEIWPIREWERGPGFRIDLSVSVPRRPPTLWQRWFGTVDSVACEAEGLRGERRQTGDRLVYRATIAREVPDRLFCFWGDEDHVDD